MNNRLRIFVLTTMLLVATQAPLAATFVVKDIRVEGLQRIAAGTVFSYMPFRVGDSMRDEQTAEIIRALYKTGFFKDVRLERDGNVLVVIVQERPAVAEINFSGNKDIETDALKQGLKDVGLSEGRVYDKLVLDKMTQELKRQYYDRGKYAAQIETTVTPLERNRVALDIAIREGKTARIKEINIVGNQVFDEDDLLDELNLSTGGLLSFVTKDDQYSRQKLQADLETLRSYYQDRGYLKFDVASTQVNISPDKESIFLTINVEEGDLYTISDIQLAGRPVLEPESIFPLIHLRRGQAFSRKQVIESAERVSAALSDQGYAFANVNPIPEIDENEKAVSLTYFVDPGKRVYVRRVNIKGNTRSRDVVVRREMRQMEAGWFSSEKVRESRKRLQRLGYFEEVNIETPAVPGSPDQVDVNVSVKERATGSLMAGVGYSQSSGVSFQARIQEDNFFGTGKKVAFGFNTSSVNTLFELTYDNPYYTIDGVSRGFTLRYRETDLFELDAADYSTDIGEASINFGWPLTAHDRVGVDAGYQRIKFNLRDTASDEIVDFVDAYGDTFDEFFISAFWSHDSRDSAIFPTEGWSGRLSGEVAIPGSDLTYYKISYKHQHLFPLSRNLTLAAEANIGYGDGYSDTLELPLYENFFTGGPGSVRGFKAYSLGPRDSNDDPIGGNLLVNGNLELWFPPPFFGDKESMRMAAFFDIGNVYNTDSEEYDFDADELRYSTGVALTWMSPLGVLTMSLAYPLNDEPGDETEEFQFTFGTTF